MTKEFNNPELQKQWEAYQDYVHLHDGQAYKCMSFDEWREEIKK